MTSHKLIVCIVPHNNGELITDTATAAGAGGGTIIMGRGTASGSIIQMFGFGDTSKDIACIIASSEQSDSIINAVVKATSAKKVHFGILFTVDVFSFMHAGAIAGGDDSMTSTTGHQMITIIANKGYADDIMAAARKAGAGGGTIVNARGTAKDGDVKFFGMEIVPEKEMLHIIVENSKAEPVLNAICMLPCLSKPGSGIVFSVPAGDFMQLGREK
jgi:nitrogen regulatory protein PII